jgi:hypothetical protein
MRKLLGIIALLVTSLSTFSQGRPGRAGGQGMNNGRFYGRIVDEKTEKGIDACIRTTHRIKIRLDLQH